METITNGHANTDLSPAAIARLAEPLPWDGWETAEVNSADLALLTTAVEDGELVARLPDQPSRRIRPSFLEGLGEECVFPPQFVAKLSPSLQAQILNERLAVTPPRQVSLVSTGEELVRFLPGDRTVLPAAMVADRVYNRLTEKYGGAVVEEATACQGEHFLRLSTPFRRTLTGELVETDVHRHEFLDKADEVLSLGVQIRHEFREGLSLSLAVKRLACYNTATSTPHRYSWRVREDRGETAQLAWLDELIESLSGEFGTFIDHAQLMTHEDFEGHPRTALQATAKAMRLPKRLLPALFAAYDQEPGPTHWHLWNAVTRMASHSPDLTPTLRRGIWETAGQWAGGFDMVTARLPRPLAISAGGQIIAGADPDVIDAEARVIE